MNGAQFSAASYSDLVHRARALAQRSNVTLEVIEVVRRSGYALPFLQLRVGAQRPQQMLLSAGFHGDEPAGICAAFECAERLAALDCPLGALVLPCTNPTGFSAGRRCNDIGYDLNRTFGQQPAPRETEIVREAIAGRSFACTLDLHEDDDADGFYIYEHVRAPELTLGPAMVARVRAAGFPIHSGNEVEGYSMHAGCVFPKEETTSETIGFFSIFLFDYHTPHSMTTETPVRLPLAARVAMHVTAFEEVLERERGR